MATRQAAVKRLRHRAVRGILRFAATPAGTRVGRYVAGLDRLFMLDSTDMDLNGELWLLDRIATTHPSVIFDVGANRGDWADAAAARASGATIHAFEPIPDTFDLLQQHFATDPRVITHQIALSDGSADELSMWVDQSSGSAMSSATAPPRADEYTPVSVSVASASGADFARRHDIGRIDLLKIDVEGHEMQVLVGFREWFESSSIDVVQFEFTLWAAIARTWLAEYYEFFDSCDFAVGRLMPNRVAWKAYEPEDEQFVRANYVAARRGSAAAQLLGLE